MRVLIHDRRALWVAAQVQGTRTGQFLATPEVVIEEQAQPHEPSGPVIGRMGQDKAHRPDDMGRSVHQNLALDQRLADQTELVVFQIAQATVDQLAGTGRGPLGQVIFFAQDHGQAATSRIPRHASTVDAAANYKQIDHFISHGSLLSDTRVASKVISVCSSLGSVAFTQGARGSPCRVSHTGRRLWRAET